MSPRPINEEELHAYVDGLLDQDRREAVARWLEENPDAARRVAAWSAQREELRAAFAARAAEPIPPALNLTRLVEARLLRRRAAHWRIAAGVVLAFGIGAGGGWALRSTVPPQPGGIQIIAQEAVANHLVYANDRRRPVELWAQDREDLARWLGNRLHHPVTVPDLSGLGYTFMGGRLAATERGPAGLLMYDDAQGRRLTVFLRPMEMRRTTPINRIDINDTDGCAWIEKGIGYSVVADQPYPQLERIAAAVRQQTANQS